MPEPSVDDADDRQQLAEFVRRLGASPEEIESALQTRNVGGLALDLVLRADSEVLSFAEAVALAGVSFDDAARYWRALGFPDPTPDSPRLPAEAVPSLQLIMSAGRDLIGEEGSLALARVMGASLSRMAQALVDVFRVQFETPQLAAGVAYADVVERYATLAQTVLPPFVEAVGTILRRHLVAVASATWSSDDEGATAQRDTLIGFVDLVGYTGLARTLPPRELARLIERFETLTSETAARHHGRVVKLIGDAAMFAVDDAAAGCRIALEITGSPVDLPPMRAGLAAGGAMSLNGDLFGDVVNLAARLVAVAPERTVVASEEVRARVGNAFAFEPMPPQSLKGYGAPAVAFCVGTTP